MLPLLPRHESAGAIRIGEVEISARQLRLRALAYAKAQLDAGLRPGDRVAVVTHAAPDTVAALAGNALAGLVSVPLNPALGESERAHIVADAGPVRIHSVTPGEAEAPIPFAEGGEELPAPAADAPLLLLYTSGTTGAPKGAVLSHGNAAACLDGLVDAWGWTQRDRLAHALPLFHVHGLVLGLFGPLRVGSSLHLLPRFSPEAICAAFPEATMLFGVPTMYHRLSEHLQARPEEARGLSRARLLISGSAGLPLREHERLFRLCGQRIVERYGMTETLITVATRHDGDRKPGSVGVPIRGVELRIVDDEGVDLPPNDAGAVGEILVRGATVFDGYLNRPDATAEVLRDGWFHTGDLATRDADGSLRIVGRRATDLIKTGGFKVGAGEVEAALLEHPAVREAAVIGTPDDDLGERIAAFVVVSSSVEPRALIDHVASQLAPHKRPREVHLVEALPRNAMGKVMKKLLRA